MRSPVVDGKTAVGAGEEIRQAGSVIQAILSDSCTFYAEGADTPPDGVDVEEWLAGGGRLGGPQRSLADADGAVGVGICGSH